MILRVIASLVLCASFTLGSFPAVQGKGIFVPASYDSYEVTLVDGSSLSLRTHGGRLVFSSDIPPKI